MKGGVHLRRVLSVLVENHSGVLSRVAGLFSRRGFNIDSLTVGETHDPKVSRMTIVVEANDLVFEQIKRQVNKLVDVIGVEELEEKAAVFREIALVKVSANQKNRASIIEVVDIFRGSIVDVSKDSLVIEITGSEEKVHAFLELIGDFGILSMVRTGLTALERGNVSLHKEQRNSRRIYNG